MVPLAYMKTMQATSHANPRTQINVKLIKHYITIYFAKNENYNYYYGKNYNSFLREKEETKYAHKS